MARPMASICCSPPDIVPAFCFKRSLSRGNRLNTNSISSAMAFLSDRCAAPSSRFFCTDIYGNRCRPSGASTSPRRTMSAVDAPVMSSPRKRMLPAAAGTMPTMALSVVDLPAPLAPTSVTMPPSGTFRLTSWMATDFPYRTLRPSICKMLLILCLRNRSR